jgi:hypothetical protein
MKLLTLIVSVLLFLDFSAQREPISIQTPVKGAAKTSVKNSKNENAIRVENTTLNQPIQLSFTDPNSSKKEFKPAVIEEFTPVETNNSTDPNFEKNKLKSENQDRKVNNPTTISTVPVLSKAKQLEKYETELSKYEINSVEYNQISRKIENLKAQ